MARHGHNSYVIQQPHSKTNPTGKFRVVYSYDWMRYVNGAVNTLPIAGEFTTYTEAQTRRDELNSGL